MKKVSVDQITLKNNKSKVDVTLFEPPIVLWEYDEEIQRVFQLEIGNNARVVYRPESPLPSGATVYVELYE